MGLEPDSDFIAGVSAALCVVEEEFEGRDSKDSVQEYPEAFADGRCSSLSGVPITLSRAQ
jgi:hypothetical protein